MTKRERVIAAFKGQETDCTPVCFWKHVPQELWGTDDFIKAQVDFYKETDVDFVSSLQTGTLGGRIRCLKTLKIRRSSTI